MEGVEEGWKEQRWGGGSRGGVEMRCTMVWVIKKAKSCKPTTGEFISLSIPIYYINIMAQN